jgi:glycosyltransferase involved in cell wall biosynthesis
MNPDHAEGAEPRGLLVLDTSYTFEMVRERGLDDWVTCRDLDGFFTRVWSVHPFATLLTSEAWTPRYGKPVWHRMNDRHCFIEGKVGRFPWLRRIFILNFLFGQLSLFVRLIRRERIKVIRVGDPLYLGLFGWGLCRLSGIPFAIRVNGNNVRLRESTGRPIFPKLFRSAAVEERIERFVFKRADLVAAPNQDNLDFAVASGARPELGTIFRYGNVLAKEHAEEPSKRRLEPGFLERLGIEKGKYLLCIGRLEPVKFPEDAVHVLGHLCRKGHDVKLVFAGDGSMEAALSDLAAELGAPGRIVFAGNTKQQALAQLIPNAALVVSPLTGRALTEAAFGAAPIVAYDLDWQGELIVTGVSGELIPFRDVEGMGKAAERFLNDPAYAAAMGQGARDRAMDMLNPEKLDQHEREEYSRLMRRHGVKA